MANLFYLDVDDEITSAAARIRTSKDPRVGLVVPPGSRIATSRINFRLLAREAVERNRALSIISTDAAARALAASAGLPAFATVGEFEADQGVVRNVLEVPAGGPVGGLRPGDDASTTAIAATAGAGLRPTGASGRGPAPGSSGTAAIGGDARVGARSSGATAPALRSIGGTSRRTARIAAGTVTVVLIGLVFGLIGAFLLPSATIVITPKLETVGPLALSIRADPNATSTDPVAGVVPASIITMDFTASGKFNATGKKTNTTTATGAVKFTNFDTSGSTRVGAGSAVSTNNGIAFTTNQDVTVPIATFSGFRISPGTASVGVTAVTAGLAGNVASATIRRIPSGYSATLLKVTNPNPTSGGTATTTVQIQKSDTDAAVTSLTKNLKAQFTAWAAAPGGLAPGSTAFAKTAVLGAVSPDSDPASLIGVAQPTFALTLTASSSITAVDESTVTSLASGRLGTSVRATDTLVSGSEKIAIGTSRVDGPAIVFPVTASATQVRNLDPDTLRGLVAGKSVDEARSILATYGSVDIQTWPGFVGSIPSLAWRLSLSIDTSTATGSPGPGSSPGSSPGASSPPSAVPSTGPSAPSSVAPSGGPSGTVPDSVAGA